MTSQEATLEVSPHIERARVYFGNDAVEIAYVPSDITPAETEAVVSARLAV